MVRKKRKRNKLSLIILGVTFLYFIIKTALSYLPVEVIAARPSVLEDVQEGEFIVLRREIVVTAPFKGRFTKEIKEGERVAKDAVIGYMEKIGGSSLGKQSSLPIKAPKAGIVYYHTDGFENICNPEKWAQLDLSKLDKLQNLIKQSPPIPSDKINNEIIESGEGFLKIVDNLVPCYFYLAGSGAYLEKVKKGDCLKICLEENPASFINAEVEDVFRKTGSYGILIKVSDNKIINQNRKEKGKIITSSYKGVVLSEKVLVKKDDKYGVYLFRKGRANWQEVEITARFKGKVVLKGLSADDWIITNPQRVREGKRIFRLHK